VEEMYRSIETRKGQVRLRVKSHSARKETPSPDRADWKKLLIQHSNKLSLFQSIAAKKKANLSGMVERIAKNKNDELVALVSDNSLMKDSITGRQNDIVKEVGLA
jgi:hypothetical protein